MEEGVTGTEDMLTFKGRDYKTMGPSVCLKVEDLNEGSRMRKSTLNSEGGPRRERGSGLRKVMLVENKIGDRQFGVWFHFLSQERLKKKKRTKGLDPKGFVLFTASDKIRETILIQLDPDGLFLLELSPAPGSILAYSLEEKRGYHFPHFKAAIQTLYWSVCPALTAPILPFPAPIAHYSPHLVNCFLPCCPQVPTLLPRGPERCTEL